MTRAALTISMAAGRMGALLQLSLLLATTLSSDRAAGATSLRRPPTFAPPVIVHGAWNTSAGLRLDGNESILDSFYSLGPSNGSRALLFGQYEGHLAQGQAVFVASSDSGASWSLAGVRNPVVGTPSPRTQKVLDQFCNNVADNGADCIIPQTKRWGRSMAPYYARYDQGLKFGAAWRCYSHESLSPDLKHWSATSKTPSAFCSAPGAALQLIALKNSNQSLGWAGAEQTLTGAHGLWAPNALRTLGKLQARSPTSLGSASTFEYSIGASGELRVSPSAKGGTSFTGLPKPLLTLTPNSNGQPYECIGAAAFYEPVASIVLPDGSFLACSIVCFDDSPAITVFGSNATTRVPLQNGTKAGRSLVAWRSDDGSTWRYVGTITDAKDMMARPTRSLAGNSEENDLSLMADGKTVMCVMRTDGDCNCASATGHGVCGLYREYYQAYSSDFGHSWSSATPISGTGCARPRLLSLGVGRPLLMSGGRRCVANETGLYLWVNPSGLPNAAWERYSLSYAHNQGWSRAHPGETSFLFDERVNQSNEFETQAYTSLMKVPGMKVGDNDDAYVVYNKYWGPRDGWPGCYPSPRG
eukprot:SAG31_NODE_4215_length_3457_cov_1.360036_3_plen_585_part_00